MSVSTSPAGLPSEIQCKLHRVRVRHALLAGLRAIASAACVLLVLMFVSMAIDWAFPFMDSMVRVILTTGTLTAAMLTIIAGGLQPVREAMRWTRAAGAVDDDLPQLEERWSTVASLAEEGRRYESPIAKAMADQVASEAIAMGKLVRPKQITPHVSTRPALIAVAASGMVLLSLCLLSPTRMNVLLRRFWSPRSNITATQLISQTGDQSVPRGERITLVTKLRGLSQSNAMLMVRDREGDRHTYPMRPDEEHPDRFAYTMRVDESLEYRVRAGDGQTEWHRLDVIDFPEIADLQFSIEFPEYTRRDAVVRDRMPRTAKVIEGSTLSLALRPVEPLEKLSVALTSAGQVSRGDDAANQESREVIEDLVADQDGWYRFRMQLLDDVIVRPTLWSPHGLKNQRRLFSRIDVVADKAPVARVISPSDETAVAVDDSIEISFEAHDDHGIASAELVIYDAAQRDADGNPRILDVKPIPLGDQRMQKHLIGKTELDLKTLDLAEGSEISYAIRVTDNRGTPLAEDPTIIEPADVLSSGRSNEAKSGWDIATDSAGDQLVQSEFGARPIETSAGDEDDPAANAGNNQTNSESLARQGVTSSPQAEPGNASEATPLSGDAERMAAREVIASNSEPPAPDSNPLVPDSDNANQGSRREPGEGSESSSDEPSAAAMAKDERNRGERPDSSEAEPSTGEVAKDQSTSRSGEADRSGRQLSNGRSEPPAKYSLNAQRNRSGQNTLTGRRRLKIAERLASLAKAEDRPGEDLQVRENVIDIDSMLAAVELGLRQLVDRKIADADRGEQFRRLDAGLGNVESYVADLREQTRENQFAFVGLQMVDITRTHVTPARDRVFAAIQHPNASEADATVSLQHIVRARELLAALLKRYDRVVQEKKLQQSLDESITMYEVYLEKRRMLMREARQNLNPMQRKMAVIEVDQEYLDRLAEVLKLRREMMDEFAQMLADDPRLLSRYLELVKRRRESLRDRLTEISERQYEATEETAGWLQIDEAQRPDLWAIIGELRLHAVADLAKDAAELSERIEKQMPLELDADRGTAAEVIKHANEIAGDSRKISFDVERLIANGGQVNDWSPLLARARALVGKFDRLSGELDRLLFENEDVEVMSDYVEPRLLEARTVADQADAWAGLCESLSSESYSLMVKTQQHQIAVATHLLRVEMLAMRADLDGQFQRLTESSIPPEIVAMIGRLHQLMESITFNQVAASIRAGRDALDAALKQQQLATDRLVEAEDLFDQIRRAVVQALDEYDVPDPNIVDLRDPTLDEFLAQLEREPSIAAQLGIPNRPRNLRVIADSMLWQQNRGNRLGGSGEAAAARARAAMQMRRSGEQERPKTPDEPVSEVDREKMEKAKEAQEMLEKSLLEIEKERDDPTTTEDRRRQLDELAERVKALLDQAQSDDSDRQVWTQIAQSDEARAVMQAIARGEAIPDQQWNKLLSTLDDGLWQVRGKQPPEAYRKAIEQYQDRIRELMQTIDE